MRNGREPGYDGATASRPARGQARSRARCQALLDAATVLFVTRGYADTSLSDILDRAGGSPNTLYRYFGDKQGLFRAMLEQRCGRLLDRLDAVELEPADPAAKGDPEERLVRFGLTLLRLVTEQDLVDVMRTLVSEGHRVPDIAERFFHDSFERTVLRVADYLRAQSGAGRLAVGDPVFAAEAFCGLVTGALFHRRLILPEEPVPLADAEQDIRRSVRMFLRGAGRDKEPRPVVPPDC